MLSERVKVAALPCSRTIHRAVRSDRQGPVLADYQYWSWTIRPYGTMNCAKLCDYMATLLL